MKSKIYMQNIEQVINVKGRLLLCATEMCFDFVQFIFILLIHIYVSCKLKQLILGAINENMHFQTCSKTNLSLLIKNWRVASIFIKYI